MSCKLCIEQGHPSYFISAPRCAFLTGVFDENNWQCATLIKIRDVYEDDIVHGFDESCLAVRLPEEMRGFAVLAWYKSRGKTSKAITLGDERYPAPLTLVEAESLV